MKSPFSCQGSSPRELTCSRDQRIIDSPGYDISSDNLCQEPPVKDWWHDNATLRVVLEHNKNKIVFVPSKIFNF